jgi:hypothetical protein
MAKFEYKKRPLSRSHYAMSRFALDAIEIISSSWSERLKPSISQQRTSLETREFKDDEADLYVDDLLLAGTRFVKFST